jgi:hypothetical protein
MPPGAHPVLSARLNLLTERPGLDPHPSREWFSGLPPLLSHVCSLMLASLAPSPSGRSAGDVQPGSLFRRRIGIRGDSRKRQARRRYGDIQRRSSREARQGRMRGRRRGRPGSPRSGDGGAPRGRGFRSLRPQAFTPGRRTGRGPPIPASETEAFEGLHPCGRCRPPRGGSSLPRRDMPERGPFAFSIPSPLMSASRVSCGGRGGRAGAFRNARVGSRETGMAAPSPRALGFLRLSPPSFSRLAMRPAIVEPTPFPAYSGRGPGIKPGAGGPAAGVARRPPPRRLEPLRNSTPLRAMLAAAAA